MAARCRWTGSRACCGAVSYTHLDVYKRQEKALNPDFPVIVRGDSAVQYQKVVEVLDLLRRLELAQVGLVTGKPK